MKKNMEESQKNDRMYSMMRKIGKKKKKEHKSEMAMDAVKQATT